MSDARMENVEIVEIEEKNKEYKLEERERTNRAEGTYPHVWELHVCVCNFGVSVLVSEMSLFVVRLVVMILLLRM